MATDAYSTTLTSLFDLLDTTRRGFVGLDQVQSLRTALPRPPSRTLVEQLFLATDVDRSGSIDLDGFVALTEALENATRTNSAEMLDAFRRHRYQALFASCDRRRRGTVNAEDVEDDVTGIRIATATMVRALEHVVDDLALDCSPRDIDLAVRDADVEDTNLLDCFQFHDVFHEITKAVPPAAACDAFLRWLAKHHAELDRAERNRSGVEAAEGSGAVGRFSGAITIPAKGSRSCHGCEQAKKQIESLTRKNAELQQNLDAAKAGHEAERGKVREVRRQLLMKTSELCMYRDQQKEVDEMRTTVKQQAHSMQSLRLQLNELSAQKHEFEDTARENRRLLEALEHAEGELGRRQGDMSAIASERDGLRVEVDTLKAAVASAKSHSAAAGSAGGFFEEDGQLVDGLRKTVAELEKRLHDVGNEMKSVMGASAAAQKRADGATMELETIRKLVGVEAEKMAGGDKDMLRKLLDVEKKATATKEQELKEMTKVVESTQKAGLACAVELDIREKDVRLREARVQDRERHLRAKADFLALDKQENETERDKALDRREKEVRRKEELLAKKQEKFMELQHQAERLSLPERERRFELLQRIERELYCRERDLAVAQIGGQLM